MNNKEKAKKIVVVIILNIVLPTLDIFSDLGFIFELFTYDENYQHLNVLRRKYGLSLSFFFLLNYLLCFAAWYRHEEDKLKTFIFPMMNIYPQFCKLQFNVILKIKEMLKVLVGSSKNYG